MNSVTLPVDSRLNIIPPLTSRSDKEEANDKEAVPEKKISLFATKLAILEKAASGLGNLAFIWATVVLLGGFAVTLETVDFWFVSIILLTEGFRIFSRIQEVEWQHETTLILMSTFRDEAKQLSRMLLSWLQLLSATTCVVLSLYRLAKQHYVVDSGSDTKNLKSALNIFYVLPLAESLLFLLEKAYWQCKITKLLTEVSQEYFSKPTELDAIRPFFYITYSQCVNGSIFNGLKMDFVTYSMQLMHSSARDGQLTGTGVLSVLVNTERFAEKTLRAIGTRSGVVKRLIEMLNWDHEEEIRRAAAEIIFQFVTKIPNRIRVTAIAGSMESIASLLYHPNHSDHEFVCLGLRILQNLAEDRSNCAKIGCSGGLLSKIIALTKPNPTENEKDPANLALNLMIKLASTTGSQGKALRKEIQERVFAISNLRDVLKMAEKQDLKILAIEMLTSLARDADNRMRIGGTGGVLGNLFSLFLKTTNNDNRSTVEAELVKIKAGEALYFLSLENEPNCKIMMSIKLKDHPNTIESLISVLGDIVHGIHAARILRNLQECAKRKVDYGELREITGTVVQVLKDNLSSDQHQEAFIGLAAQFFRFTSKSDFDRVFEELSGVGKEWLISELKEVFRSHPNPSKTVPNIRRFSIELLISVMEIDRSAIENRLVFEEALEEVLETTTESENYSTFSGSVGLSEHSQSIRSLANDAMSLLRNQ